MLVRWLDYEFYGKRHTGTTELVLEANPGLAAQPIPLPEGVIIIFPAKAPEPERKQINLWD